MIPAGTDSFSRIDLQFPQMRPSAILDTIKQIYVSRIPQASRNDEDTLEDLSNDPNFNEPIIDRLRVQREEVHISRIDYRICLYNWNDTDSE